MSTTLDPQELAKFAVLHPRFDPRYRILWLDLDHGKANEMGREQIHAFDALADWLETQSQVSCLCTTSERKSRKGKPIFIAGANVTERVDWSAEEIEKHVLVQRELMQRLSQLPVFTIAVTHGATLGWGTEYLLAMDYSIATPTATLALPETGLGIVPGAGGTAMLAARVGVSTALLMGCVGESLSAAKALDCGLINEIAPDHAGAATRVQAIAGALAKRSPTAVAAYKRAVLAGLGESNEARLQREADAYELCLTSGQAALGRKHFGDILAGHPPEWGPVTLPKVR